MKRLQLPPEPSSIRRARQFVASGLEPGDGVEGLALLLVSELASNAVLHARTPFDVGLEVDDTLVRVEVVDRDSTAPTLQTYRPESITGRGLHMVDTSAHRWGCEPRPNGKCVWFELRRAPVRARL